MRDSRTPVAVLIVPTADGTVAALWGVAKANDVGLLAPVTMSFVVVCAEMRASRALAANAIVAVETHRIAIVSGESPGCPGISDSFFGLDAELHTVLCRANVVETNKEQQG